MAFSDALSDHLKNLTDHPNMLSRVINNYESIFAWDIYEKTGTHRDKLNNILGKITQKLEMMFDTKGTLDFNRMCLSLISCYETFLNGEFSIAIHDIDNIIHTLKNAKMNEFFKSIVDVCVHVTCATKAFILAFLDNDVQQILQNIKPFSNFSRVEKAALFAIKSNVFLEYPPGGDKVALEFIESARNFNNTEIYWTNIWLIAKGRVRRYDKFTASLPFREELEAAKKLSSYDNNLELLLGASNVYQEAGFMLKISKIRNNIQTSNDYYKLSADLVLKVYKNSENNLRLLYCCLSIFINFPNHILKNNMHVLEDITKTLSVLKNDKVHEILGKYYLKIKKDYKNAKFHLEQSCELFSSSLQMLKVECLMNSVDSFPVVQYLNSMYEKFTCPKRRLIIVSQIILYYIYCERNSVQLLHYLNIYLNEDIDYKQKKHHINAAFPMYQLKTKFKPKNILNVVANEIEQLKTQLIWSSNDKKILENVVSKFSATCNPEKEDETETEFKCIICLEVDVRLVVLRPCGHQEVCKNCWNTIKQQPPLPLCPMCRTVVTLILH